MADQQPWTPEDHRREAERVLAINVSHHAEDQPAVIALHLYAVAHALLAQQPTQVHNNHLPDPPKPAWLEAFNIVAVLAAAVVIVWLVAG